jgi:pimeloyl-ACP methyl ester carboxylesterase
MSILQSKDVCLHYEQCGTGEDMILLHGNGENLHYFGPLIPALSQTFRVTAVDMRGHGDSDIGNEPLTFELLAKDVARLMDALAIEKAHILGFSDGGNTALTFALGNSNRVRTLILNGANLNPRGMKGAVLLSVWGQYLLESVSALFSKKATQKRQITDLMVHQPKIPEEALHVVQVPTLVIAGERDMIRRRHTERIAKNIENAMLVIVKDADHFVIAKQPQRFLNELYRFYKEQGLIK